MMEEKVSLSQEVMQSEMLQTEANQIWQQLAATEQQQILQRMVQICRIVAEQATKRPEVLRERSD